MMDSTADCCGCDVPPAAAAALIVSYWLLWTLMVRCMAVVAVTPGHHGCRSDSSCKHSQGLHQGRHGMGCCGVVCACGAWLEPIPLQLACVQQPSSLAQLVHPHLSCGGPHSQCLRQPCCEPPQVAQEGTEASQAQGRPVEVGCAQQRRARHAEKHRQAAACNCPCWQRVSRTLLAPLTAHTHLFAALSPTGSSLSTRGVTLSL